MLKKYKAKQVRLVSQYALSDAIMFMETREECADNNIDKPSSLNPSFVLDACGKLLRVFFNF